MKTIENAILLFIWFAAIAACNSFTPSSTRMPISTATINYPSKPPATLTSLPSSTPSPETTTEPGSGLTIQISTAGNSWVENNIGETEKVITEQGISNWTINSGKIVTYVYLSQKGDLDIALSAQVPGGSSTIEVSVGNVTKTVTLTNTSLQQVFVGRFPIEKAGYASISMLGSSTTTEFVAEVPFIIIGGSSTQGVKDGVAGTDKVYFINEPDQFYWARRGPSVHLFFQMPTNEPVEWFYSEVTVPVDQDVIGSYFMANGFDNGYFGVQVNSPIERRVLFSIWSPYQTDDPSTIPPEYRIELLRKGDGVITGEFGNEGSGGQSYKPYLWQAGQTYRFLVRSKPVENDSTEYSAYFYAPEQGKWFLIANFRRPKTQTYLTGAYSFLENFIPESGQFTRQALYGNQWVRTKDGKWLEITKAHFSYDDTAAQKWRWDYQGGIKEGQFYLKNCGFFSEFTAFDTPFERPARRKEPDMDLTKLP